MANFKSNNKQNVEDKKEFKSTTNAKSGGKSGKNNPKPQAKNAPYTANSNQVMEKRIIDMTALNFDYPISTDVGQLDYNTGSIVKENSVFTVKYIPTLGAPNAANLASQKLFGELRKVLNVPSTYEAGDLFMYCMAVESLDLAVEHLKRVVRLANTYQTKNMLYPRMVLTALKYDIDEVIENAPRYREVINKTITAMQYLTIPTLTQAHSLRMNLAHFIYTDQDDQKAQSIIFDAEGYWQWNVASGSSTTPSDLTWLVHGVGANGLHNVGSATVLLNTLMTSLLYDADGQRIHGDILKVWGDNLRLGGTPITAEESQERKFDPYILYMLHNATIHAGIGATAPTISWVIPSGSTSPYITETAHVDTYKPLTVREIIDGWKEMNSQDVLNLCRWKSSAAGDRTSTSITQDALVGGTSQYFPLEILTSMERWQFNSSTFAGTPVKFFTHIHWNGSDLGQMFPAFTVSLLPLIYVLSNTGTSSSPDYTIVDLWGDRNYWTIVDFDYLNRLSMVATEANYNL